MLMLNLEEIKNLIIKGKDLEEIIEGFDWREFEGIVAEIFEKNNFKIKQNFRFKTKNRYEIDLIGISPNFVLVVDCKQWGKGRSKISGLKIAAEKQEKRTEELKRFLKNNPIAKRLMNIDLKKQKFYPILVTWTQENLTKENKTLIVPVWKLNSFLIEVEKYL